VSGDERAPERGPRVSEREGRGRASLPTGDVLDILTEGRLEPIGLMPGASNYTFLAEVCRDDHSVLAIYKPQAGEAPLWDFPDGTLCRREVAAYALSATLGWPLIPPTVLRNGPHGPGSVQLFVDADLGQHFFTLRQDRLADFLPVAAFDVVVNNADRKAGHCLLDPDGRIWLVDHGVCFHVVPKLRTVIWEFAGAKVPQRLRDDLRELAASLRGGPLRGSMLDLLDGDEVDATAARADHLASKGRFPEPGSDRPYPWPPI
jgi:hypothetical protein